MRAASALAALAAMAPAVLAVGSANVYNNCPYDVYLWAVDTVRKPSSPQVIKSGASYSEAYQTPPSGGVSLKLAKDKAATTTPTQFEYTLAGGFIWYDGSHVDCRGAQCPFYADGIYLAASDASCPTRTCKPNQDCTGFYINWNDDVNTLSCNPSASVSMYLCSQSATTTVSSASTTGNGDIQGSAAPGKSLGVAAASSPQGAQTSSTPKVQMEALGSTKSRARRHVHNHMRRHSHQ